MNRLMPSTGDIREELDKVVESKTFQRAREAAEKPSRIRGERIHQRRDQRTVENRPRALRQE